jgi:hypothetical protein
MSGVLGAFDPAAYDAAAYDNLRLATPPPPHYVLRVAATARVRAAAPGPRVLAAAASARVLGAPAASRLLLEVR